MEGVGERVPILTLGYLNATSGFILVSLRVISNRGAYIFLGSYLAARDGGTPETVVPPPERRLPMGP